MEIDRYIMEKIEMSIQSWEGKCSLSPLVRLLLLIDENIWVYLFGL